MVCETIKKGVECVFMRKTGCSYNGGGCYPIIDKCEGCAKVKEFETGKYCISFPNPAQKWQAGFCPMATHVKKVVKQEEQKINPLKASKRSVARK
jgi:hypothetical protein